MSQVIPILPCANVSEQSAFYVGLGFQVTGLYTRPPYLAVQYGDIELHFYSGKKVIANGNASMCFIRVEDVDRVYSEFTANLKRSTGKVPRSGMPHLSKIRDLVEDRRFTLTDPAGNTLYIGTPSSGKAFFRTLVHPAHAADFATLYDLMHSKETPDVAFRYLPRLQAISHELSDMDQAKVLLVAREIHHATDRSFDDTELAALIEKHNGDEWQRIADRFAESLSEGS